MFGLARSGYMMSSCFEVSGVKTAICPKVYVFIVFVDAHVI